MLTSSTRPTASCPCGGPVRGSSPCTTWPSRFTADDVCERYGADPAKVRVVPNAPTLPIGDAPVPAGEPYIVAVGDLRPKKNLDRLVAAWRASGTEHRLVVA